MLKLEKAARRWRPLMRCAYQAYVILQFIEFARTLGRIRRYAISSMTTKHAATHRFLYMDV